MGVVLQTCTKGIETIAWFFVSNILKERKELQIMFPHAVVHCWWKYYCNKTKGSPRIRSSFFQPCLWRRKGGLEIKSSSVQLRRNCMISDEAGCLPVFFLGCAFFKVAACTEQHGLCSTSTWALQILEPSFWLVKPLRYVVCTTQQLFQSCFFGELF
jgi:hypothetical protein